MNNAAAHSTQQMHFYFSAELFITYYGTLDKHLVRPGSIKLGTLTKFTRLQKNQKPHKSRYISPAHGFAQTDEDGNAHEVVDGEQHVAPLHAQHDPDQPQGDVGDRQPAVEAQLVELFAWRDGIMKYSVCIEEIDRKVKKEIKVFGMDIWKYRQPTKQKISFRRSAKLHI